jgi:hypothetical protein
MESQQFIELQLHYIFFKEADSQSMNAMIFNECEKHFIQAIEVLNKYLDFTIEVEVFARRDGSLESLYKIIIEDPIVIIIITSLITTFFASRFPQAIHPSEEIKNRLENIQQIKELIKSGELTEEMFDYVVPKDKDLKKLKSKFFKSAKKEKKLERIEIVNSKSINDKPMFEKKEIIYTEFENCILKDEFEKDVIEVDAKIYIVAPILIKGISACWRGIFNDESIEFRITDKNFLEEVYGHIHQFSNGTYINGKMKIIKTLNLSDNKLKTYREVFDVINCGDDNFVRSINKRKRKLQQNKIDYPSLFSDNSFENNY